MELVKITTPCPTATPSITATRLNSQFCNFFFFKWDHSFIMRWGQLKRRLVVSPKNIFRGRHLVHTTWPEWPNIFSGMAISCPPPQKKTSGDHEKINTHRGQLNPKVAYFPVLVPTPL